VKVNIHLVVSKDGDVSGGLYFRKGKDVTDVALYCEDFPETTTLQQVTVEADLDMEALFRDCIVRGVVREDQAKA